MNPPLILIITTLLYSGVHSLTASNQVKRLACDWFGSGTERWYRISYNFIAGITFIPILWLLAILPDQHLYTIPMPWVLLTVTGQCAGAAIIVIGIAQTGTLAFIGIRQLFPPDESRRETGLITTGLYGWVRHPLYTGGLLLIWLSPVMTHNLLTLFILLTIYLVAGARLEEKRLAQSFGEAYERYKADTPMLVPGRRKK